MSWQIALIAASTAVTTYSQYQQGQMNAELAQQEAAARAQSSEFEAIQHRENAELIRLQTEQEEEQRRREFALLEQENISNVSYDPYASPSFLASMKYNRKIHAQDLTNLKLMGAAQQRRALLGEQAALSDAQNAISLGSTQASMYRRTGFLTASSSLLKGSLLGYRAREA